jgi:hypothetical protein
MSNKSAGINAKKANLDLRPRLASCSKTTQRWLALFVMSRGGEPRFGFGQKSHVAVSACGSNLGCGFRMRPKFKHKARS